MPPIENLRNVQDFHVAGNNALLDQSVECAFDIHQTSLVGAAEIVGSCGECEGNLFLHHMAGYFGLLDAERAAESATAVGFGHLDIAQALDVLQEGERLLFYPQHACKVAAFVIRNGAVKVRTDIGYAQHVNDKLRELVNAGSKLCDLFAVHGIVGKKMRVFCLDRPCT